ncbi:MAG: glycerophosphoryl diester phosphodiesterase membrane domain-containing protein [Patescibacteria group bacterium]
MNKPLIPAGELLRSSWDQFRNDWKFNLEGSVRFLIAGVMAAIPNAFLLKADGSMSGGAAIVSIVLGIGGGVLALHASNSFTHALLKKADGQTVTALDNNIGWKYFWPAIWVGVLQSLAVLGGFILLVIPGIWLAGRLAFSNIVLIDEDKRGTEALKRSSELVKGRWWAIFWRSFVSVIVYGLLMMLISLIVGGIIGLIVGGITSPSSASSNAFGQMLSSVIQSIFIPLFMIFTVRLYKNLKATM